MALGYVNLYNLHGSLIGNFATIQQAVDAAATSVGSNKKIVVDGLAADGVTNNPAFVEQVTVNAASATVTDALTGLTIQGINGAILQAPTALSSTATSPTNGRDIDGVLTLIGTTGVTVTGLTVDGAMAGGNVTGANDPTEVGIAALNATGTVLDGVDVTNVRESVAGFGAQRNFAVYAANAPGSTNTFTIQHSTVENFQKNGIVVLNAAATIVDNTVTGVITAGTAQNGIEVGGSSGTVSNNRVTGVGYTHDDGAYNASGILEFDGHNLNIDHNTITIGGVYTTGVFAYGSQTNVNVTNNTITGAGPTPAGLSQQNYSDGVYYQDGSGGGAVTGNTISPHNSADDPAR